MIRKPINYRAQWPKLWGSLLALSWVMTLSQCSTDPIEVIDSHKILRNDSPYLIKLAFINDTDTVMHELNPGDTLVRCGICYSGMDTECVFENDWSDDYHTLNIYFSEDRRLHYARFYCTYWDRNPIGYAYEVSYAAPDLCGYYRKDFNEHPWHFVYSITQEDYLNATIPIDDDE